MKKIWKFVISGFIVGIIVAVVVFLIVFRKSGDNVALKKADFRVTCDQIVGEFEADEQQAGIKYIDKIVEVEGLVAEVNSDTSGVIIILRESDAISGVSCSMGKSQDIDLTSYPSGAAIKVKGICTGYLMDVTLNKGAIVKN